MDEIQIKLDELSKLREYLTQKTKGVKKRKFCCKKSKGHNTYYIDGKYVSKLKHLDKITAM
nr:hypothetical protein [Lachnospiraceae bacterium]